MNSENWILIKDKLPPRNTELLFKTKSGRRYVGILRIHQWKCDGTKEYNYRCITARGSEVTGLKPIAWMYLPD